MITSTEAAARSVVLLVDDDPNDALLLEHAWHKARLPLNLIHLRDGREAIVYLEQSRTDRMPLLIFLDIKMPHVDGFETLQWIKSRPVLNDIPVLMFSSSPLNVDRSRARDLGADSYLVKPT